MEVVEIIYTENKEEIGFYINPHSFIRRLIFREPELIHIKFKDSAEDVY